MRIRIFGAFGAGLLSGFLLYAIMVWRINRHVAKMIEKSMRDALKEFSVPPK